jgi:hypothetical protein
MISSLFLMAKLMKLVSSSRRYGGPSAVLYLKNSDGLDNDVLELFINMNDAKNGAAGPELHKQSVMLILDDVRRRRILAVDAIAVAPAEADARDVAHCGAHAVGRGAVPSQLLLRGRRGLALDSAVELLPAGGERVVHARLGAQDLGQDLVRSGAGVKGLVSLWGGLGGVQLAVLDQPRPVGLQLGLLLRLEEALRRDGSDGGSQSCKTSSSSRDVHHHSRTASRAR